MPSLAGSVGAALRSLFPGNDSQIGLTHTHTAAEHLTNIMQPTSYSCTCTRGHFGHYLVCSGAGGRKCGGVTKRKRSEKRPRLKSLLVHGSHDDSGVMVKSRSCESSVTGRRLVSILDAAVLFQRALQLCESTAHETSLPLTPAVTCSTPPLSREPTH